MEHLQRRRVTIGEYAIFSLIILLADYRTGIWIGSAKALSKLTGKSVRWCQYALASLRSKGYISGKPSIGRGSYMIRVTKYHSKEGAAGVTLMPNKAQRASPYKEVVQEKCQSPLTPLSKKGGQIALDWCGQTIIVEMGHKRRLPSLHAYTGAQANDVVDFLSRHGFPAQIAKVA